MGYIIDPQTYKVLKPFWYSEKHDDDSNGPMQKITAWPVGSTYSSLSDAYWTFIAAINTFDEEGWNHDELNALYNEMSVQKAGPGWIFLKGMNPPWLEASPYIALYPPYTSAQDWHVASFRGMFSALTGASVEYFRADTVEDLVEQVKNYIGYQYALQLVHLAYEQKVLEGKE